MTLKIDQTLQQGRYRIRRRLGQGGMGAVYLAEDQNLSKQVVAIKENVDTSAGTQEQFEREAVLLARLNHPNLPRVTDHFIEPSGRQYLVMDYVHGDDLREFLDKHDGFLAEAEVLNWIDQVLDALEFMHNWIDPDTEQPNCIVHRDIKPSNIRRSTTGRIVLVDFGLAKVQSGEGTLVGARAISPGYSPVEQYTGGTDVRSDIYALGATLYHLLTAQRPPEAPARAAGTTLPTPRKLNPAISRNTERVLLRALQIQAQERFQSSSEMRAALHGSRRLPFSGRTQTVRYPQSGGTRQQNPFLLWGIALISLLLVALLMVPSRFPYSLWNYWLFNGSGNAAAITPATNTPTDTQADVTPTAVAELALATATSTANPADTAIAAATPTIVTTVDGTATMVAALQIAVSATQAAANAAATTTAAAQPPTATPTVLTATPLATPTDTVMPSPTALPADTDHPTPDSAATSAIILRAAVAATLTTQADRATATATPQPPTATWTATPSASPTPTHTAKPPTSTPMIISLANANALPATATATPQATPTPLPTNTPTLDAQATIDAQVKIMQLTLTAAATPTPTATPVPTTTFTPTPVATLPPPTLAPTVADTATPTATPLPLPTASATATKTATATPTPLPTATKVPLPTLPPTNTPLPTAAPTSTPEATPTPTTLPAPQPTATPRPVSFTLIEPVDAVLSGRRLFRWNTSIALKENQYFEMVFWPVGQDPLTASFGPAGSVKTNELTVDLDKAAQTLPPNLLIYGHEYQWGVLLVEINPYKRLQYVGGSQRFYFGANEGSSGNPGSDKSKPAAKPTNTPRG